jgi:hypothetical protein
MMLRPAGTPDGKLIPLLGIVRHLTRAEWRWIDGAFGGAEVSRPTRSSGRDPI